MSDVSTDNVVTISVNGKEMRAAKGELVIDVAERNGVYIPRFCYHNRMRSVGMCRMCIVEIDTGRGPAIQPSCMIECTDGMQVDTESDVTKKAQDGVLEFLLVNHPLDCPVCDKGGECPLQDQTLSYGPGESRFIEEKRHFEKPIPISDLVYLDRERCILCDRCTRFASEVAGDPLIHFLGRGYSTQVNTFPDHPFSSYFSGNTVQICPVGALTATSYRFRARPWDLEQVESTCTTCSVGCRVVIDSSRNRVLRYNGVDSDPVNWSWLCDKGRFDFEYVNSAERLTEPLLRSSPDADLAEVRWTEALGAATRAIASAIEGSGPESVAVIGGSRLTNEDAYAWAKFAKGVIGTDNVDAQLGDGLPADVVLGLPRATIDEVCRPGGTVIILGPDPKEELPVLFLRLRHAVVNDGVKLVELSSASTSITDLTAASVRYQPGEAADIVAALLGDSTPPEGTDDTALARAREVLRAAEGPVTVVLGRANIAEPADSIVAAAGVMADGIDGVKFLPALRRGNVIGAIELGLAPGVLPGKVALDTVGRSWFAAAWGVDASVMPSERGLDTTGILRAAADGAVDTLILLGADPIADFPDRDLAERALAGAGTVIALDIFLTESTRRADIVFPVPGYACVSGTTTNMEGRITRLEQKVTAPGTPRAEWIVAAELAHRLGTDLGVESSDDIWDEIVRVSPTHAGLTHGALDGHPDGLIGPVVARPVEINGRTPASDGAATKDAADAESAEIDLAEGEGAADAERVVGASEGDDDELVAYGRGASPGSAAVHDDAGSVDGVEANPPQPLVWTDRSPYSAPNRNAYSLRLVVNRKLYDHGTLVEQTPSLAPLAKPWPLRVNPYDFGHLGVPEGAHLHISSRTGASATLEVVTDPGVARGLAALVLDQSSGLVGRLIDAELPVTDIRVETTS